MFFRYCEVCTNTNTPARFSVKRKWESSVIDIVYVCTIHAQDDPDAAWKMISRKELP